MSGAQVQNRELLFAGKAGNEAPRMQNGCRGVGRFVHRAGIEHCPSAGRAGGEASRMQNGCRGVSRLGSSFKIGH